MATETERRLEILEKIGDKIENELQAKPHIFVVGSVREGTAKKGSDIDCIMYVFTDKGPGRTARFIKHIFREELQRGDIPLPSWTPTIVVSDEEELAMRFLAFVRQKEHYKLWPFFKGKCVYGKEPDKLRGKVGKVMRREIGMMNFKGIMAKVWEIDDAAFQKGMSKPL